MEHKHVAWGCPVCNKMDWVGSETQRATPEHVAYRGVDIGSCNGKMVRLYKAVETDWEGEK